MKTVGVRELRDHLKDYVDAAKSGETITITERGKPVAKLTAAGEWDRVLEMVARGELTLPKAVKRPASELGGVPLRGKGPGAVELVREQRR